jgi:hypothetical protein
MNGRTHARNDYDAEAFTTESCICTFITTYDMNITRPPAMNILNDTDDDFT